MSKLFETLDLGDLQIPNRIVMAPMTRSRADDDGLVGPITATYYAQRAGAGLILSEGIFPTAMGKGYVRTPGLVTRAQTEAWRRVTDAVHEAGGRIFAQLMHTGRISDPSFLPGGALPVAPSAIAANGSTYTDAGLKPLPTPRALETGEIPAVIDAYRQATERAFEAGFDGVEFHAASGYLPEQFLSSETNRRTDRYGGSIENRLRFVREALEAIVSVRGGERVGIKIAPELGFNDVRDETPLETYGQLVESIAPLGLAYLHVAPGARAETWHELLRPRFGGAYLAGGGFDQAKAAALLAAGGADGIVFGNAFIANPDLPARFRLGAALAEADRSTFYSPGPSGYIDYPAVAA